MKSSDYRFWNFVRTENMFYGPAAELKVSSNYWLWLTQLLQDLTWDFSWRNDAFGLLELKKHMQQWQASISNLILIKDFYFSFNLLGKLKKKIWRLLCSAFDVIFFCYLFLLQYTLNEYFQYQIRVTSLYLQIFEISMLTEEKNSVFLVILNWLL